MKIRTQLTVERLKALLHYEPLTGIFTWRIFVNSRAPAGSVAGSLGDGYVWIRISRVRYSAHRLAWLYMTGRWPDPETDHKNRVRNDNRWNNLREASVSLNQQNRSKATVKNITGFLGVSRDRNRFYARICVGGTLHHLGSYKTPEMAHSAYLAAKRRFHSEVTL